MKLFFVIYDKKKRIIIRLFTGKRNYFVEIFKRCILVRIVMNVILKYITFGMFILFFGAQKIFYILLFYIKILYVRNKFIFIHGLFKQVLGQQSSVSDVMYFNTRNVSKLSLQHKQHNVKINYNV